MITYNEALENPELMIKYKDDLKNIEIFGGPWYWVFWKHPYLYREFLYRCDEMSSVDISCALKYDPTLVSDLEDYLHKMGGINIAYALKHSPTLTPDLKNYLYKMDKTDSGWLLGFCPELSLCIKYKDDPNRIGAACYVTFPHKLDNLNKEEKREMSKRIMELLREEKI